MPVFLSAMRCVVLLRGRRRGEQGRRRRWAQLSRRSHVRWNGRDGWDARSGWPARSGWDGRVPSSLLSSHTFVRAASQTEMRVAPTRMNGMGTQLNEEEEDDDYGQVGCAAMLAALPDMVVQSFALLGCVLGASSASPSWPVAYQRIANKPCELSHLTALGRAGGADDGGGGGGAGPGGGRRLRGG